MYVANAPEGDCQITLRFALYRQQELHSNFSDEAFKQGIILPNMSGDFNNLMMSLNQTDFSAGNPNIDIHFFS